LATQKANYNGAYPFAQCKKGKYLNSTVAVGHYPANAWGLYDMHGNVEELCLLFESYDEYPDDLIDGRKSLLALSDFIIRGGSWYSTASDCRSAYRFEMKKYSRGYQSNYLGFRLAFFPPEDGP
jgi:formylglycine-generating enzyme required for sulfatase activity